MSISQFLQILWGRKLIILATTISCLLGGLVVVLVFPPRWQAHSRVMLNLLKPDPITGEILGQNAKTYVSTQIELIKDYSVAGELPDKLGWTSDPTLIARYQARSSSDTRDFRHFLAQIVIDNTKAELLEGSNIIEITYTGTDPQQAKAAADALRQVYIDNSLTFRRTAALKNAQWYQDQSEKSREALNQAQTAVSDFERKNGIVIQSDKDRTDVEGARLRALSNMAVSPLISMAPNTTSPAQAKLDELDAEIKALSGKLGPNHPELQALHAQRDAIAGTVAKEKSSQGRVEGAAAQANAIERSMQSQKARVIQESGKLGQLQQLQTDVDNKLEQYNKTTARASALRQEAAAVDDGITPLGTATVGTKPAFPDKLLIFGGTFALGLAMGTLLGILAEMLTRRVRGWEDLANVIDAPMLAAIPEIGRPNKASSGIGGFARRLPFVRKLA